MKRIRTFLILTLFLVSMTGSAFAAGANTEQQTAASYLREAGIMVGNETGDMMLDQGLTRAQMAAVLTRIVANPDHVEADSAYYRGQCKFTDVPDWAKVYVGYCAANHLVAGYAELISKEIRNELLQTQPEYLAVQIPSADCILADKLTAFAPHTTGILLNDGKDMEVMKQFYDVTSLLDIFEDTAKVHHTYTEIAKAELAYRGSDASVEDCLRDTFDAALCLASRGKSDAEEYPLYVKGIRDLRGHIYAENYSPEIAATRATKVMYMAACLLTGNDYERIEDAAAFAGEKLTVDKLMPLAYLRKVSAEAYAYAIKTDRLIAE